MQEDGPVEQTLRIRTPFAIQRAATEKYGGPGSRTVMNGMRLNVEYQPFFWRGVKLAGLQIMFLRRIHR